MKLLVALEAHFYRTPDGRVWNDSVSDASFWQRYLKVFPEVLVVARVKQVETADPKWKLSGGENIEFWCLPDYQGPWQYLKRRRALREEIKKAVKACDAVMLRVPGAIGTLVWNVVKKTNKPYACEVVGDPWDSLAPGTVQSIARPLARVLTTWNLKRQCEQADGVSYVTEKTLQRRYPNRAAFYTHYSSIELYDNAYADSPRTEAPHGEVRIFNAGSMATLYKAQDVQIQALHKLRARGINARLVLAGDGVCRAQFEEVAASLELSDKVDFLGLLPGPEAVRRELDRSDLFILPSRTEGLPRAVIEAMARGLPCIGTNVGGIPELLEQEDLVPVEDAGALAERIAEMLQDAKLYTERSDQNWHKAKEYHANLLSERRTTFYTRLRRLAEQRTR
ncbi:glycosyltransferase involved in cell wall biosynthesis [Tumebacillus sp. BK434]|uniref:glycosyltransferase n=1 Tax=Tumebacillus sp. BK434 TaxID=2512169 RepID=UPI0010521618|nr:glycosyltransferase [Tumebacillus sp. BK434]TCP52339.1 glycosyltransferase involved in cell wall biosynthesis [Tumebacillus sp. BK434]